ncbi:interleukin-31 receptor subunit alpha-like [Astyanax mexicanus]|uniref:Interleukin-31 receptor subunit alpha-like n=1 Tax=Astyanax mexicanus TaxID=7994 RepID=A0A8B9RLX7_ASTMX|nr:interleukin-31 receptor subunit alpha-like [Astyanax mexicanus]
MCQFVGDLQSSTGSLIGLIMQTSLFIMVVVLYSLCEASSTPGREICDVFPKNQLVKHGSDVVISFRAPVHSVCHNKTGFDPSRVSWKLNNRMIADGYYNMTDDSTFSVSIPNFSLATGTVEFLMDGHVLSGTLIRTYSIPQNISCIGNLPGSLNCTWDHDQYTTNTSYEVVLELYDVISRKCLDKKFCRSKGKSCKIEEINFKDTQMFITVIAETPAVKATSDEVTYNSLFATVKLNPPEKLTVEPELNGLMVKWYSQMTSEVSFEVRFLAAGSEPVVKNVNYSEETTIKLSEIKECTNYSISVRCKLGVWSEWSQNVTHLSYLNVSNVQINLWRSRSVADGKGKRRVHLMWKGIPPSCKAFDEYRLFYRRSHNIKTLYFSLYKNHTFIYLDENMHTITVAAFRNNTSLAEASINIPSTEDDLTLPPLNNVRMSAGGGQIYVTWDKPNLTVSGYIIVWNSTEQNHMWQHTEETHFSLKGQNFTLYTIYLTALYKNSPVGEMRLQAYAQEKAPAAVLNIRAEDIRDRKVEIHWRPISPTECCAFVVNYTVFYKAQHETGFRNVSVDKNQHSVMLDNLKPSTTYMVYVQANAAAASSKSNNYTFSTKTYGENYLIGLIMCGIGLILLPVFVVFIIVLQKKYVSEKFPNPRLSSLSMWSTQKCKNPWNHLAMPWDCESEKILKCQVEAEDRDVGKLTARAADHSSTIQETAMITTPTAAEKENAVLVRPNVLELASHDKEEKRQPLQPVDHQTSQNRPGLHTQSPYRIQSPVTSPVDSPKRTFRGTAKPRSSETEMLLKPKSQNTALPTTYVTVDMFEKVKRSTK